MRRISGLASEIASSVHSIDIWLGVRGFCSWPMPWSARRCRRSAAISSGPLHMAPVGSGPRKTQRQPLACPRRFIKSVRFLPCGTGVYLAGVAVAPLLPMPGAAGGAGSGA